VEEPAFRPAFRSRRKGAFSPGAWPSGYLTRYRYDTLGNLTGVCQKTTVPLGTDCVQSPSTGQQTRTFTYDPLGRMLTEQNPETGTVTYTYDSDAGCSVTNTGDLVKRHDAAGNNLCYYHDSMHRLTDVGTPTVCKRFRYDNSTGVLGSIPAGVSISNPIGRMVEAETDTCASPITSASIMTDEWFSYSARGEVTDVYESTKHSGGYYDVKQTYWESGAPKQLSNLPGLPAITYGGAGGTIGLDGEGRILQVTAGTGLNPLPTVTYNNTDPSTSNEPLGALLSVNFGTTTSGQYDSDSFIYDKNTGRLKQYTFSVGAPAQTDVGQLTWNQNGSLSQLQITDNLPGTLDGPQTCNYTHDDLGRINTVDCGSSWYQSFSYDPFGNITKNPKNVQQPPPGTPFLPTYDTTNNTNRVRSLPGGSVAYDNNGNITTFTDQLNVAHTYTWDAGSKMLSNTSTGSTINMIYDALGRMVEQVPSSDPNCNTASDCKQIVYGPGGDKLALMHGQNIFMAFVPLPGGATAVYAPDNSTPPNIVLKYYRHSDHLGSSRLASTPSRTLYYSGAYAPFGESYAETGIVDRSFTGQNEDTVPSMVDFMYREYTSNQQGRWLSPDPAGLAAVSMTNPQTWNRYAYVHNHPLTTTDFLGLDPTWDAGWGGGVTVWGTTGILGFGGGIGGWGWGGGQGGVWGLDGGSGGGHWVAKELGTDDEGGGGGGGVLYGGEPLANGDVALPPLAIAALGGAGRLAGFIQDPKYIAGFYGLSALGGLGLYAAGAFEGGLTVTGIEAGGEVDVTASLQDIADQALARFEQEGFTPGQQAALENKPNLEPMFRGERIDAFSRQIANEQGLPEGISDDTPRPVWA